MKKTLAIFAMASIQASLLCFVIASENQVTAQQVKSGRTQQPKVILGVLEDLPGEYAGDSDFRAVRAVFEKNSDGWSAFPTSAKSELDLQSLAKSYPNSVTWTIAFDGKNLGVVTAETPKKYNFYSEIGIETITSKRPVPTVGKKSTDYAGFTGDPVYRPLVAISQPNVSDSDHWKPAQLSQDLIASARQQFRSKFPIVTNCRNADENIPRSWKYHDEDIHITKAYASNDNWSLIDLNLTGYACDGPQGDDSAFVGQWYVKNPAGELRFLGTDMWLVDAGDYDNRGSSEVLFSIDRYNRGGYRLFYRNFTRSAEFEFSYQ